MLTAYIYDLLFSIFFCKFAFRFGLYYMPHGLLRIIYG